jgi:hypothetical protein
MCSDDGRAETVADLVTLQKDSTRIEHLGLSLKEAKENACSLMPQEPSIVAPWQRLTIYRYTLPPPYEATEHLCEELPLSTYPSGTTMEPLAYEMAPGAHLGRAAPWQQALVLFPPRAPTRRAGSRDRGVSFHEACDRGYLRPYAPQWGPD